MKKKVIAGTIAASLTFTALAGLPLSNKGLAEKLGVSVAYAAAADSSSYAEFAAKIKAQLSVNHAVYAQSVADAVYPDGKGSSVASVTYTTYAGASAFTVSDSVYSIGNPVVGKLNLGGETDTERAAVDKLLAAYIKFMFDQDADAFDEASTSVAGAVYAGTGFYPSDINAFLFDSVNSVQQVVYTTLNGKSPSYLAGLTGPSNTEAVKSFISEVFSQALSTNATLFSTYLKNQTVNGDDFANVFSNFRSAITKGGSDADVFDKAVAELLAAYIDVRNVKGTEPIFTGGGPAIVTDPSVAQLVQELAALKSKIAAATGEEKEKLIAQAISKANEAVTKLLTLDLSSKVQNVNGKATLTLTAADVTKLITAVADAKKALADAVGSADGLDIGDITINLGAITQSGASVTLPQELWTLASDVKADGVAIKVGELSATLPVGTFTEAVTLGITIETGDAASSVTSGVYGKSVASDVYGFDLQVGGKAVEQFNKPIKLRLPLKNLTGLDKELLTTGRVEADGKISTQGGTIDGDFIVEPRYSFSKYFVFENKVTFNDIAKVQAWAGRQIQVVAAKGAIEGKSAGVFAPQDKITRAEFAKILITALNLDNTLATSSKFSDVPSSHWAAPYIAVAVDQGIINGKSPSTFAPNATITRAEMATMIARALKATQGLKDIDNAEAALSVFKDANKIGSAFRSSVAWAAASDIIIGSNGKFLPNDNATRAEAAVIIYRALNFKPQAPKA
ncbi:S-layer homology domain-containing protein [Cohnella sp. GbtcB17]|uniref:S-layer homology domain-containing protein n=1 Tax=Cohnella sp. GbtcB17 TaxID=2824762 RepID=UPI001C302E99|nr:S-layer homology domain-containing protein [Cohnella sp. GbtcB17]